MKFHSWLKNSISFASQANELIMTYRFYPAHCCHLFKKSISLLPRVLQYEAHFLNLLVGSQDQCITRIHNGY